MIKPILLAVFYTRLIFAIVLLGIPSTANAGFISFVADFFTKDGEKSLGIETNSQNMALLQAIPNVTAKASSGGGDITIVDGSALLPETGPSGEVGESLKDRPTSDQISVYVVRKGDTLSQIAKMFDVSVSTIVWGNDIRGGIISEGQTLVILPVSGVSHTVKSGDTLKSIASKYKADIDEILQFNNLSINSKLAVGDVVIVPDGEINYSQPSSGVKSSGKAIASYPTYSGYYIRPLVGGRRTQGLHGYNGVDIASTFGTPILASASGNVIISRSSGWNGGYGQYIVIRHDNGTQTLYSHLSQNIVFEGSRVVQGQVIGYMGSTGKSTGTHLHFEVRGAKNPF